MVSLVKAAENDTDEQLMKLREGSCVGAAKRTVQKGHLINIKKLKVTTNDAVRKKRNPSSTKSNSPISE